MAQAYSYFLIEYEKVDIFLIQNKDNINHKSFFKMAYLDHCCGMGQKSPSN